jgi:isopentenyl-diphosphate delta-isomerase
MDELICVDVLDRAIGKASKEVCHESGLLHRAFSVFLHRDGKLLLQQRARNKYHSGGLWANACCSHPRYGESIDLAVSRRLYEELGAVCKCNKISEFAYFHQFHSTLFEYEYDHVFLGEYKGEVNPNPEEIMDVKWMDMEELSKSLVSNPELYTVWFLTAAPMVIRSLTL